MALKFFMLFEVLGVDSYNYLIVLMNSEVLHKSSNATGPIKAQKLPQSCVIFYL